MNETRSDGAKYDTDTDTAGKHKLVYVHMYVFSNHVSYCTIQSSEISS